MFTFDRFFFSFRMQLILISLLAPTAFTSTLLAATTDSRSNRAPQHDCSVALPMDGDPWVDDHLGPNEHRLFAIDLDHQGLLNAEANRLGPGDALPSLEVLDDQCRPLRGAFAMHRAQRSAIIGHPATYFLRVSAPPRSRPTNFRLQVAFAPLKGLTTAHALPEALEEPMDEWEELVGTNNGLLANGGGALPEELEEPMDEWEELVGTNNSLLANGGGPLPEELEEPMDEWEELVGTNNSLLANDGGPLPEELEEPMDEWEELVGTNNSLLANGGGPLPEELEEPMDEWEELVGGDNLPLLAAFSDWRRDQSRQSTHSSAGRWQTLLETSLCPRTHHDDHSDTLGCASPILLGGSLRSELEPLTVDDRDTYTFVVARRARVILQSGGDLDLRAVLIDASGQRLVLGDSKGGFEPGDFHLDLTLQQGRYYLRVDSASQQVGPYVLDSAVVPEGWQMASDY